MRKLDLTNGGISCRIKRQYERGGIPIDIKKTIEDIVEKLKSDEGLKIQFLSDPAAALEKLTGIDLPDDPGGGGAGRGHCFKKLWKDARRFSGRHFSYSSRLAIILSSVFGRPNTISDSVPSKRKPYRS